MEAYKQISTADAKYIDPEQIDYLIMKDGTKIKVCCEKDFDTENNNEFTEVQGNNQVENAESQNLCSYHKQIIENGEKKGVYGLTTPQGNKNVLRARGGISRTLGAVAAGLGVAAMGAGIAGAVARSVDRRKYGIGPGPMRYGYGTRLMGPGYGPGSMGPGYGPGMMGRPPMGYGYHSGPIGPGAYGVFRARPNQKPQIKEQEEETQQGEEKNFGYSTCGGLCPKCKLCTQCPVCSSEL